MTMRKDAFIESVLLRPAVTDEQFCKKLMLAKVAPSAEIAGNKKKPSAGGNAGLDPLNANEIGESRHLRANGIIG